MNFSAAYLLVFHGSRDPRPQIAVEHLAKLVSQRLQRFHPLASSEAEFPDAESPETKFTEAYSPPARSPSAVATTPLISTAALELAPLPLHQQIQQFGAQATAAGYSRLKIVPLFLLQGVHVMEDIPAEVAIAQQALGHSITVEICHHLGSHPHLRDLLLNSIDPMITAPQTGKVLLSHGSRRPGSNQSVEAIAAHLGALPAYWSVSPSLESQVTEWIKRGCSQIAVLPYFLFPGGITEAIAQEVSRLAKQFPYVQIHLSQAISATPALANLVVDLLTTP